MINIPKEELKYENNNTIQEGYRLVYFENDDIYFVGAYSKTLEGFMLGFSDIDPIIDLEDIPKFVSIEDILERSLVMFPSVSKVAIYKTDGTLVAMNDREKLKK